MRDLTHQEAMVQLRELEAAKCEWSVPEPTTLSSPASYLLAKASWFEGMDVPMVPLEGGVLVRLYVAHYNAMLRAAGMPPAERARLLNMHPASEALRTAVTFAHAARGASDGPLARGPLALLDSLVEADSCR